MSYFLALLFIGFSGWVCWKFASGIMPTSQDLRSGPYDPEVARRALLVRERFDNPYYYSGISGYGVGGYSNELDNEITHLHDQFECRGDTRKQRHDRLWLIAQLKDHKRHLQRQWKEIEARNKAEQAEYQAQLPALLAEVAERERQAKLAQEQATAQAAREAAQRAERERQAYRDAIAKAASQAPNEAP